MSIMEYIDKVNKNKPEPAKQEIRYEKKYCENFVVGEDGYCINYIKPKPLLCKVKLSDETFMEVEAYTPAVVSCREKCLKYK